MKNKGFTLIELIGVILLLALIVVITVPKVFEVIRSSKEESMNDTIKNIEKAANLYATSIDLDTEGELPLTVTFEEGKSYYEFADGNKQEGNILDLKGQLPDNGKVIIYEDKSFDYELYNPFEKTCMKRDSTNYLNESTLTDNTFKVTFNKEAEKIINIGTLDISNFKKGETLLLDYDAEYTDAVFDFDQKNAGFVLKGTGNVTGSNPGISFENMKLSGTGVYHASTTLKLTEEQKQNSSFNMDFVFNHYTSGTMKISNIKITKKDAVTVTNGACS